MSARTQPVGSEHVETLREILDLVKASTYYAGAMMHDDPEITALRERIGDFEGAIAALAQQPTAGHSEHPLHMLQRAEAVDEAVDEAMALRLDDYLGGEFDIRIGKQAAHAALHFALASHPGGPDRG